MSLLDELNAGDKKGLFESNDTFVNYSTGLLPLDYANGFWLTVGQGSERRKVPIIGIIGGTFISIIGSMGTGKSTLADQIGYSIIKDFKNGALFHIDCEKTNLKERMIQVTGSDYGDRRLILKKDEHIYIEDVLEMFNKICIAKEAGGNLYKYEVEDRAYDGKKFLAYEPTVFVIDSLPSFNSRDNRTEEDLGTNMDGARAAKDVTRFYNNCLGRMMRYNITIIAINHIVPKVVADPYSQPPSGLMMLGKMEQVNRGYAAQYYSQNYFRLNAIKSNFYKKEDVGFTGFKGTLQIAKTKTSFVGSTVDIAFNGEKGFDPVYTLYEYANANGLIDGRNPFLRMRGFDDLKFSRKDFCKKFVGEENFRNAVFQAITPSLEAMLGSKELTDDDRIRYGDFMHANDNNFGEGAEDVA